MPGELQRLKPLLKTEEGGGSGGGGGWVGGWVGGY